MQGIHIEVLLYTLGGWHEMLTAILYIRRMLLKKTQNNHGSQIRSSSPDFLFCFEGGGGGKGVTQSKKQDGKYSKVYFFFESDSAQLWRQDGV